MAVKNAYSLIRDLMVKIKPVYLKDIYIIKHKLFGILNIEKHRSIICLTN